MNYYINTQRTTNNKPEQDNLPNREEVDFFEQQLIKFNE